MPFTRSPIDTRARSLARSRAFKIIQYLRQNLVAAYGLSVIAVALSFLVGIAVGEPIIGEVPFGPFYPAVMLSAFIGGLGPAAVALATSSMIAWYWFVPPEWPITTELVSQGMFVLVNAVNITLVVVFDAALMRVLAREHEVRTLMETAHNGIVVVDDKGAIRLVNRKTEQLFGYTRDELLGKRVGALVPERCVDTHDRLCTTFMHAPQTRAMGEGLELYGRRKDGSEFPIEVALNGFDQQSGKFVLATIVDTSERKKAAEQQKLLMRELHHRIQNLFAVVQSIIRRSLKDETGPKHDLLNRLQALSRTHSILTDSAWEGAQLDQLLRCELEPYIGRAVVGGCELMVTPVAAQTFCLIVHELTTNAAKYGALSVPHGSVTLTGSIGPKGGKEVFTFRWIERNGPQVKIPTRRGFGSTVLIDAAKTFGARTHIDYATEGLRYELVVPLTAIQAVHRDIQSLPVGGVREIAM